MINIKNIVFKFFIFILTINVVSISTLQAENVKILIKINNQIITNIDIEQEARYLIALNKDLNKLNKEDLIKISKDSLIREKVKFSEINRIFNFEEYNNREILDSVMKSFYSNLGMQNEVDFQSYLNENNLNYKEVKNKIKIEVLWNQLIGQIYKDQIFIDEKKLKENIKINNLNVKTLIEYDLSEIVFELSENETLKTKFNVISNNINEIGFGPTANKFSISDSAKFGGKIGKIQENQLSKIILSKLKTLKEGEISNPIKVGAGYLILKVNEKSKTENVIDEEKLLKSLILAERQRQFNQYSLIHFNKIKLNSTYNE